MKLEVIATCMADALTAEECGADRLELITAITEGGLTPGIGLVKQVVRNVGIPVHVMVRPHSRSFHYSNEDIETMALEIESIREAGAAGIVVGAITRHRTVDERALERLVPLAGDMQITFHRAFDELDNLSQGMKLLHHYPQITRVLTSGGVRPAAEAIYEIWELVQACQGKNLQILAGHGLTPENVMEVVRRTGVREVHFGSAVRQGRAALAPIDAVVLRALADELHNLELRAEPREGDANGAG